MMVVTYELLQEKGACIEGLKWFRENFPEGCELTDETIAKVKDCPSEFVWWFYKNVRADNRLYQLVGVSRSDDVSWSNGVLESNDVSESNGVSWSKGVSGSFGVSRSRGVSWSNGVSRSFGVSESNGVSRSFGVVNSNGVDCALFLANKPQMYSIFGAEVDEPRYREVSNTLYQKLGDWRPSFNNIKALWLVNGSDWTLTPITNAKELSIKEAWKGMPEQAIKYLKELPEFDAETFKLVTGIEVDADD